MEYVISDTHFFHEQLLGVDQFAPRPYHTTLEISRLTTKTTNQNGLPMSKLRPSLVN